MSERSLARLTEKTQRLQARVSGLRERAEAEAARWQNGATTLGGAYLYGALEKRARTSGQPLPTVMGLPPAASMGLVGYLVGPQIGGRAGEMIEAAALGVLSAEAYKQGNT